MPDWKLAPGTIAWANLEPVSGREQGGHRPVLVVSSMDYLKMVDTLFMLVPITSVDRQWPNHVLIEGQSGLARDSWAMTEQVRTLSRLRITHVAGTVSPECLAEVREWLGSFLDLISRG